MGAGAERRLGHSSDRIHAGGRVPASAALWHPAQRYGSPVSSCPASCHTPGPLKVAKVTLLWPQPWHLSQCCSNLLGVVVCLLSYLAVPGQIEMQTQSQGSREAARLSWRWEEKEATSWKQEQTLILPSPQPHFPASPTW